MTGRPHRRTGGLERASGLSPVDLLGAERAPARRPADREQHRQRRRLAARDVGVAEWVMLRALHDGSLSPSELARRLGMTRGAITKLADRLAGKGLLTRAAGAADRRYQSLSLTAAGRRLVPALAALADRNGAEFFGHLDAATRRQIEAAMREIVRRRGLHIVPVD